MSFRPRKLNHFRMRLRARIHIVYNSNNNKKLNNKATSTAIESKRHRHPSTWAIIHWKNQIKRNKHVDQHKSHYCHYYWLLSLFLFHLFFWFSLPKREAHCCVHSTPTACSNNQFAHELNVWWCFSFALHSVSHSRKHINLYYIFTGFRDCCIANKMWLHWKRYNLNGHFILLRRTQIPATNFLIRHFIGSGRCWETMCASTIVWQFFLSFLATQINIYM